MSRSANPTSVLPRFNGDLRDWEKPWMAFYPLLSADGYALRDRYNLDWKPQPSSAIKKAITFGTQPLDIPWENRVRLRHAFVMDATRKSDGLRVMIKAIDTTRAIEKHEWRIARVFIHPDLIGDPRNHCIPTIDYVRYPGTTWELLVTPQLYPFHVTPFETFREVADFVHQLLEGIVFMHGVNVPHRDIGPRNLTMFSPDLFPNGTSALCPGHETNIGSPVSKYRARRDVYVRYYIIDFGLSWSFSSEATRQPLDVVLGQYKDVPEYAHGTRCDGFALDVWCIGKLIKEEFAKNYSLPTFLLEFAALLMRPIPNERPTAAAALSTYEAGVAQLGPGALDLPLWPDQPKPSLVKSLRRVLTQNAEPAFPLSIPRDAPPPMFEFSPRLARYNQ